VFNFLLQIGNKKKQLTISKKTVEKNEVRNILEESTRITRQPILPLNRLKAETFNCLFIPGGYGVGKNLSNFSTIEDMNEFKIDKDIVTILKDFHSQKKPIGLICLAPVLAAKIFSGCQITLGDDTFKHKIDKLGSNLVNSGPLDVVVDKTNFLASTSAYCHPASKPNTIYNAIGKLVDIVLDFDSQLGEGKKK